MPLPGKLTIGILEEDNPVKAYFRIRPMYVLDGESQYPPEAIEEKYPEDGCIRIVPDKNELAGFKNRMRSLGRYCALDLRRFPGENEKIRPNKNYGNANERNAYIVYSDAVGPVPPEAAAQVLDAQYVFVGEEITLRADPPGTRYVLVRREGQLLGPWVWSEARDVAGCISLRHAPGLDFLALPEDEFEDDCLDLSAARVVLMTRPGRFGIRAEAPSPETPIAPPPAPEDVCAPLPALAPPAAVPTQPSAPAQPPAPAQPFAPAQPSAPALPVPAAVPGEGGNPLPAVEPEPPRLPPEPRPPIAPQPWSQKIDLGKLKAVAGRISLRDQALQAQSGMNPRRGRSLSEVVDEQWRRSRFEQLGHPVPPQAMGKPVLSPIDRAVEAVRDAWEFPDARGGLLGALLKQEELRSALLEALKLHVDSAKPAHDKRVEEMEAERLKLMAEIDALRVRRADLKTQLMEELRQAHQRDFDDLAQRCQAMREELTRSEAAAKAANEAAQAARSVLEQSGGQLLEKMVSQAAAMRAAQRALDGIREQPVDQPQVYQPTTGELVSDLRVQLERAGFLLDNERTVALLLCLITGGFMVLSGPPGCGKTQLIRHLAQALGLNRQNGRFLQANNPNDRQVREMMEHMDALTPAVLLLDDANLPGASGVLEGALRLNERARAGGLPLCVVLTVQDAPEGMPLPARLLSRAFFLRLSAPAPDQPWQPVTAQPPCPERAVALDALKQLLPPADHLPGAVEERLSRLRQALEEMGYRLDRRTLNEAWIFCAGMMRAGRMEEMEALDLALSQRALPAMLAGMELEQLMKLPEILCDMPHCLDLMAQPLPLPPL